MNIEENKEILLDVLNSFFSQQKIEYQTFNSFIEIPDSFLIDDLCDEFGVDLIGQYKPDGTFGITPIQLIQNITKILCGQRLAFIIDDNNKIVGVQWYEEEDDLDAEDDVDREY